MSDLNHLEVQGRIVKNAEMRKSEKDVTIVSFTLATNHLHQKEDKSYEETASFIPLAIFGERAEKLFPYLVKGRQIIIEGFLKQERWEKDDKKYSRLAVGVKQLHIIFDKKHSDADAEVNDDVIIDEEKADSDIYTEEESEQIF